MKGQTRINSKHSVIRFLALIFGVFEVLALPRSPSLKPNEVLGVGQGSPTSQGLFYPLSTRPQCWARGSGRQTRLGSQQELL